MKYDVVEIFYSLQGEGYNQGRPAIFVRLAGCNMSCKFCDTNSNYVQWRLTAQEIYEKAYNLAGDCRFVVFTGGEPALQLQPELPYMFKKNDWVTAMESNGSIGGLKCLVDWMVVSPKVSVYELAKNFLSVSEIRYAVDENFILPDIEDLPSSMHYYLSPIDLKEENIQKCIKLCKENPKWKLSLQIHKIINIR